MFQEFVNIDLNKIITELMNINEIVIKNIVPNNVPPKNDSSTFNHEPVLCAQLSYQNIIQYPKNYTPILYQHYYIDWWNLTNKHYPYFYYLTASITHQKAIFIYLFTYIYLEIYENLNKTIKRKPKTIISRPNFFNLYNDTEFVQRFRLSKNQSAMF